MTRRIVRTKIVTTEKSEKGSTSRKELSAS